MPSELMSNSQLRTWKRCRRKYWLTYMRKLKLKRYAKTGARQLGTRVHGALERFYAAEGKAGRAAALAYLEDLRQQEIAEVQASALQQGWEDPVDTSDIDKEHELAATMVTGYCDWVEEEGVDEDIEVVATEAALRVQSPVDGIELIGKLDAIIRKRSTGDEGFLDHKTVGDLTSPLKTLRMDEQFRMYALMQRLLQGDRSPVRFQLYNMLKKSKRTVRAKPPFFAREEVYINDAELRSFYLRLYRELIDIRDFEMFMETASPSAQVSIAYPTPTNDCSWDCDFFSVCPMFDDPTADPEYVLQENYEVGDPHEHYEGKLTVVST